MNPFLRTKTLEGLRWSYGSAILLRALSPLTTLILAAFLTPGDFGQVAVVTAIIGAGLLVGGLGLGEALVVDSREGRLLVQHVFRLRLLVGAGIYAAVWAGGPALAAAYDAPSLVPVSRVMGLAFLLDPFGSTSEGLLHRELRFRRQFWFAAAGSVAFAATGITLAAAGAGIWALAGAHVAMALARAVVGCLLARWFPGRLPIPFREARQSIQFGSILTLQNMLGWLAGSGPPLILGVAIGTEAAGLYTMAMSLAGWPHQIVTAPVGRVFFPLIARAHREDPASAAAYYEKTLRWVAIAAFPLVAALAIVVPLGIPFLGPAWRGTIPVFLLLLGHSLSSMLLTINDQTFKAAGAVGVYTRFYAVQAVTTTGALGLTGFVTRDLVLAVAALSLLYVGFYAGNFLLLSRVLRIPAGRVLRALLPPLPPAIGIAVCGGGWLLVAWWYGLPFLATVGGAGVAILVGGAAGLMISPARHDIAGALVRLGIGPAPREP